MAMRAMVLVSTHVEKSMDTGDDEQMMMKQRKDNF